MLQRFINRYRATSRRAYAVGGAKLSKNIPLPLREPIGTNSDVDPVDVVVTKRSLSRLGHFNEKKNGLTPFPDKALFEGLKTFQEEQGLAPDGIMKPDGPTAQKMGSLLFSTPVPDSPHSSPQSKTSEDSRPAPEQCDHLFFKVDVPVCHAIRRRRGKRASAICYHSAMARYSACLHGRPIDELPPLATWNQ